MYFATSYIFNFALWLAIVFLVVWILCITNVVHLNPPAVGYIFLVLAIIFFLVWVFSRFAMMRTPAGYPIDEAADPMSGLPPAYGGMMPSAAAMGPAGLATPGLGPGLGGPGLGGPGLGGPGLGGPGLGGPGLGGPGLGGPAFGGPGPVGPGPVGGPTAIPPPPRAYPYSAGAATGTMPPAPLPGNVPPPGYGPAYV
ncbi:hypothetical protein BGW37DRAFT_58687 [Umbelopsis sp. PMI_123]|nr:hypothetical protein BGW37DRAFT_58687 [Umbelopsis sp. PMI_123]